MGNIQMTPEEFEALLRRVAKQAAQEALEEIGLHGDTAVDDMREIRSLLVSWRQTRAAIWQTFVRIGTTGLLLFIAGAVWMTFKGEVHK